MLDALEPELNTVVRHHVDTEDQVWVLWKRLIYFETRCCNEALASLELIM